MRPPARTPELPLLTFKLNRSRIVYEGRTRRLGPSIVNCIIARALFWESRRTRWFDTREIGDSVYWRIENWCCININLWWIYDVC